MTVSHDERALARQLAQVRKVRRKEAKQARPKNLKADRGRVRDTAHLAYVRRLPCVATYVETGRLVYGCQAAHLRLNSAAHGKTEGGQRKPSDAEIMQVDAAPVPAPAGDELRKLVRDLRDKLMGFIGATAEYTDCGPDVEVIKRADAFLDGTK